MDPNLRAVVGHLFPRASMHIPPNLLELGPIVDVALRGGALVFTFVGGLEMRFALDVDAWAALLRWVYRGERLEPGTTDTETYRRLAEIVGAVPHLDA